MKAVVHEDTRRVGVQEVADARVEEPGDVVVRVTSSAIRGTDLHMYDGRTGAEPGLVLGHEPLGVVEEVGPAVTLLRRGERVVVPTHLLCGLCFNCIRGYTAACLRVRPGSFGAAYGYAGMGPYRGAQAELLRGAGEVYVVDHVPARLDKAGELGATPVDFTKGDPVERIRELQQQRLGPVPPWGEGFMDGVMCAIDAVGFQARDRADPSRERPAQVVEDLVRLVNPTGQVGIAGVYAERDLDPAPEGSPDGSLRVRWASLFNKGVSVQFGRTHDRRYTTRLRDLVVAGRARPGRIVTHHRRLEDAPGLYQRFDQRADGVIKAVLRPA